MAEVLINIHVVIAEIIACILCVILVFIVFCQTIYYLCLRKLIRTFYFKDEAHLSRFTYSDGKKSSKIIKYDDIHTFFRITTSISMLFCFICSISSLIAITHLMITGSLAYNINYIRFTCFVSWLFSHYSMSSVFVGRLYVSFKDSIFQYPLKIIRILSISLASLPILLIISFLFWMLENNNLSLIFFISFIGFDVAFSIILTWLFIQKLYLLLKGRIMTSSEKTTYKSNNALTTRKCSLSSITIGKSVNTSSKFAIKSAEVLTSNNDIDLPGLDEEHEMPSEMPSEIPNERPTMENKAITNDSIDKDRFTDRDKDITPYLGPVMAISPTFKMELPSIADEPVPELCLDTLNTSYDDPQIITSHIKNTVLQHVPSESTYNEMEDENEMKINTILDNMNDNRIIRMDTYDIESHGRTHEQETPMPSQQTTPIPMVIDLSIMDNNDNMDGDTPIPNNVEIKAEIKADIKGEIPPPISVVSVVEPNHSNHSQGQTHTPQRSSSNKLIEPVLHIANVSNGSTGSDTPNSVQVETPKTVRFIANDNVSKHGNPKMMRDRSNSRAKRFMTRASSISKSLSTYTLSPRHSKAFIKAKKKLDEQQLQLINSMTRHGLLLFISTFTSLTCLIYIMFTFQHYESMDINDYNYDLNKINIIAYYYLYWNMGISSFLNGLSLYLSFAFAQWFYAKVCNKIHKWIEAFCVILVVKRLKRSNSNLKNVDADNTKIYIK